jgi:hypothetical protein
VKTVFAPLAAFCTSFDARDKNRTISIKNRTFGICIIEHQQLTESKTGRPSGVCTERKPHLTKPATGGILCTYAENSVYLC